MINGLLVGASSIMLSACSVFGVATTEEAKYKVISKQEEYSLREYEPVMVASVTIKDKDYSDAANQGFRILFKYIDGANIAQEKINMTAPVTSQPDSQDISMTAPVFIQSDDKQKEEWTVSFVMPADFTIKNIPKPTDPLVKISQRPAMEVAVITFSGLLGEENIKENTSELEKWIQSKNFKLLGQPIIAGYNPPWTLPFLRRNEIQIQVKSAQ
jgi:DNA gyrase inhibitor GyrI